MLAAVPVKKNPPTIGGFLGSGDERGILALPSV